MDSVLALLCSQLETATAVSVGIGQPESVNSRIALWPWRINSAHMFRPLPPRHTDPSPGPHLMAVYFLMLSKSGLDDLIGVAKRMAEFAVLTSDDATFKVTEHELSQEMLVAIFNAAGIPLQPAMSYVITG